MDAAMIEGAVPRMLPKLTAQNRAFWTSGSTGQLLIMRCRACARWAHPPDGACASCGGALAPEAVSGKGTVFTFTVNNHQFHPDVPAPNLIAIVQLEEQDDLRIITNLVGCDGDALRCGLPVEVLFERHGEIFYPLFQPVRSAS